jgi:hypothetical protein
MHMAIEINTRTKILAGVVVLAAAGAGAWFFYLQDLLDEPPPAKVAATAPAKAAPKSEPAKVDAPKADAPKAVAPQADAGKGDPAKPAADAPKQADAGKPAAAAPAKPIPTNPDQLVAEVIDVSGIRAQLQGFGRNAMLSASGGAGGRADSDEFRAMSSSMERIFEPKKMNAEVAANLRNGLDAERMARFLEILRHPAVLKVTAQEGRETKPEDMKRLLEENRKNPPPAARVKRIQAFDEVSRSSELGSDLIASMARDMVESMLAEMQKAGKNVPMEARQQVGAKLNAMREQARAQIRSTLFVTYRELSDDDLAAYIKQMDTDTGRWGTEQLVNAVRPVLVSRGSALGREIAQIALNKRGGAVAKAPPAPAPEPLAKAQAEPAPAAAAPSAPAEPVGYKRPANIKQLYTRYNDVVTATVMRDSGAVKELLDDGKTPNARQSDGMTPLMIAVSNGDGNIASMLLAKGADPNLRGTGGTTALSIARTRGSAELVQLLQRSGAKD